MQGKSDYSDINASMFMIMACLFWSGTFVTGKTGALQFPPFTFAFLRFFFAVILAFPMAMVLERDKWKLSLKELPPVFLIGAFGFFGNNLLFLNACRYSSAVNLASIAASCPMMTALLATLLLKETMDLKRFTGIIFAFTGVLLVLSGGDISILRDMSFNYGDVIQTIGIALLAIYSILSRKMGQNYSPIVIVAYGLLFSMTATFPLMIMEHPWTYLLKADLSGWISVLYLSFLGSVAAYFFQQKAIKHLGASRTMAFMNLIPVFSVILAVIILKEPVSIIQIASTGLIILGVFLNAGTRAYPFRHKEILPLKNS